MKAKNNCFSACRGFGHCPLSPNRVSADAPGYGGSRGAYAMMGARVLINPNLKLGKTKDMESAYEGEIVTKKEGALVDKIAVDKYTGRMRSVY